MEWIPIEKKQLGKPFHPTITFTNTPVFPANLQIHYGKYLNETLNLSYHIKEKISKAMKGIGIIKKFNKTLLWHSLVIIYTAFVRPHLDYGDII